MVHRHWSPYLFLGESVSHRGEQFPQSIFVNKTCEQSGTWVKIRAHLCLRIEQHQTRTQISVDTRLQRMRCQTRSAPDFERSVRLMTNQHGVPGSPLNTLPLRQKFCVDPLNNSSAMVSSGGRPPPLPSRDTIKWSSMQTMQRIPEFGDKHSLRVFGHPSSENSSEGCVHSQARHRIEHKRLKTLSFVTLFLVAGSRCHTRFITKGKMCLLMDTAFGEPT